jgi:AcrR family transcriptional regulator
MARTQAERRDETRQRLLEAAAAVFAARGVEGASVDAIAAAADRTSGALYAHFGSKEGLLLELLDAWKNDVAAAASAELLAADTLDEQLAGLWRSFSQPPSAAGHRWVQLEHELWSWTTRHDKPPSRRRLARRYSEAWSELRVALRSWAKAGLIAPAVPVDDLAPLVVGLLIGLEMQRRVQPDAVTDALAVAGLRAMLGAREGA